MATNAFIGRANKPSAAEVNAELGAKKPLWDELLDELERLGVMDQEWSSYSTKAGWSLKVSRQGRVIVYLSPIQGGFRVAFALGDRAVTAARSGKLPPKILKVIADSKRYAEGTAVRFEVRSRAEVVAAANLAAIKLAN